MPKQRVAVLTGGHPFEAEPFFAVFDALPEIDWTHVAQPDALEVLQPDGAADFDAIVLYDMPGITFTGTDPPVRFDAPPPGYIDGFQSLLAQGVGLVAMHHAIASWPAWEGFAEIIGGRFHYQPATLGGVDYPDSGYRHDVTHEVEVLDQGHPICAGLDPSFTITDELYLFPVLAESVTPLMRSTHRFTDDQFYSADLAIRGTRYANDGWNHPPGSDLVAWTKSVGPSAIVYLQFGDGPQTYADPNYRRIVGNAVSWVAAAKGSGL